jgi:hypothetical protein
MDKDLEKAKEAFQPLAQAIGNSEKEQLLADILIELFCNKKFAASIGQLPNISFISYDNS